MDAWDGQITLNKSPLPSGPGYRWMHPETNKLAIPPDETTRREILREWHDHGAGGHPGQEETIWKITTHYYWPNARTWITAYVKGCAVCQQMKNLTHHTRVPLYQISVPDQPRPFGQVAMDLITGLPNSNGYDAILTIVDHGCSRAAVFLLLPPSRHWSSPNNPKTTGSTP